MAKAVIFILVTDPIIRSCSLLCGFGYITLTCSCVSKQLEKRHERYVEAKSKLLSDEERSSPRRMLDLRQKFIQKAHSYIGVPYHRKSHSPDSPEYKSPLFLDCCGLIRRVLRDLATETGFTIGHWNQVE